VTASVRACRCAHSLANALRAFSTSCNAVSTVFWYVRKAWSRRASWTWMLATTLPPWQSAHCIVGPRDEEKFPFENQFCSILLCQLTAPVREKLGNRSAVATPIWAVAAWICASASRISGRRRNRSEGKPTGTAGGVMYGQGLLFMENKEAADLGPCHLWIVRQTGIHARNFPLDEVVDLGPGCQISIARVGQATALGPVA